MKTREELKAKWKTGTVITESMLDELFDSIQVKSSDPIVLSTNTAEPSAANAGAIRYINGSVIPAATASFVDDMSKDGIIVMIVAETPGKYGNNIVFVSDGVHDVSYIVNGWNLKNPNNRAIVTSGGDYVYPDSKSRSLTDGADATISESTVEIVIQTSLDTYEWKAITFQSA